MRLSIQKNILEQALSQLQPFLERKDNTQITSHIYLKTQDKKLILKATDYEIGLKNEIEDAEIKEEGEITANGKKLIEIIRSLKDKKINLHKEEDNLHIEQEYSKFKLPSFNPKEYPNFPKANNKQKISINSTKLISSLKKIIPSIDSNNPKHELNGALMDIKENKINFVSTDTKRLSLVKILEKNPKQISLIIPRKAIAEIQKLFLDEIELFYDTTNLIITSKNKLFYTKLINGKFPSYERIIPTKLNYSLNIKKDETIESIKQINTVSNEIKINFYPKKIEFESLSEENIEAHTQIETKTPFQEKFTLIVNSKFLLDFLQNSDKIEFEMGINDNELPFQLKDENFLTIIMPITL
jgi:DNA polymerase-3 subunit beta